MLVKSVSVQGFRNLIDDTIFFGDGINILCGDNAQGKTNILEAIYFCSMGRSHRIRQDSRLINFDSKEAHIRVFTEKERMTDRIDVHIRKDEKKGIAVNGIPIKRLNELLGTFYTVIFSPEDLSLIKNAPSERRRFIDMELCQLSNIYYYNLQQYYKVLKQRNNLLKRLVKEPSLKDTVFVWDSQLADFGRRIIEERQRFCMKLEDYSSKNHSLITGGKEILKIEYKPNCESKNFEEKLTSSLERDIFTGSTNYGPHKDDMSFFVNGSDVRIFGSQGQQRTAALSMKLAEIDIIKAETGEVPVMLLDDVLSELDEKRQNFLLDMTNEIQSIITCTGIEDSIKKYTGNAKLMSVKSGIVKPM
ncbi:MAG: DNA replication/repair protein RecF [Lachnospiraceae bacterium]|nr:DNA replication/repair protein RecF [Lachnospiraceae bacterium]